MAAEAFTTLISGTGSVVLQHSIVAGNLADIDATPVPADIVSGITGSPLASTSNFNLVGDPDSAGRLTHGTAGNILGDGNGGLLPTSSILDTTLSDNGGPTLTHALVTGSPAIEAGDPSISDPPEFDQRGAGFDRIFNLVIDIGSIESQVDIIPPTVNVDIAEARIERYRFPASSGDVSVQ